MAIINDTIIDAGNEVVSGVCIPIKGDSTYAAVVSELIGKNNFIMYFHPNYTNATDVFTASGKYYITGISYIDGVMRYTLMLPKANSYYITTFIVTNKGYFDSTTGTISSGHSSYYFLPNYQHYYVAW